MLKKQLHQIKQDIVVLGFAFKDYNHKSQPTEDKNANLDLFGFVRQWLNNIEVNNCLFARRICELIPAQCPFAREIKLFEKTLVKVPPLCKLNPLYNEILALRFRAICYLADGCKQDIRAYY